jgi:23S rRNA maturation mini-RNase III
MEQEPAIERKNFCRRHQSLAGQTPAMAAGLTDHVWTLRELIALLEEAESMPTKRGRYAKTRKRRAREISS